jgi:beta-glucanase (GH16 family)
MLTLKTAYDSTLGQWTTGGVCACNNKSLYQTYGDWEIRARVSAGDSRVLALLWPQSGWPPEIDFMEMGGAGDQGARQLNTQTVHYDPDNKMIHTSQSADFTQWHTIGVQWTPGVVRYLVDGTVTNTVINAGVPSLPMRLDLFTHAMTGVDPTVPVTYDVDWVKQYAYTGDAGTAPAAPSGVVATPGDTSANVSWTAPSDGNSALTGYTVTAQPGGATITVPRTNNNNTDPATSATFTGLTPGTAYTFSVSASNTFGSSAVSAASAPVTVTGTPPAVTAPTAAFVPQSTLGSTASATDVPVQVSWGATAGSAAICDEDLYRNLAGGATTSLSLSPATATTATDRLSGTGAIVGYQAQADGCNGLSSPLTAGPSYAYQLVQDNSPAASYAGAWTITSCASCSGGSTATAKVNGASVTYTVRNADAAALVGQQGPAQGSMAVYVDGTYMATVSNNASSAKYRRLLYTLAWDKPGDHTITAVSVTSSATPYLTLDGLVALTG